MSSVLGTILDPAADKILMTTLTATLAMQELIPGKWLLCSLSVLVVLTKTSTSSVPLAIIILGRDVLLSLAAFYIRYSSLPPPVCYATWKSY
jgi:cardiolipin synthase